MQPLLSIKDISVGFINVFGPLWIEHISYFTHLTAMPGTFSQLYIQYVFAVKGRQNFIHKNFEEEVYKYISGIIKGKEQKPLAINGMADHIHILVGLRPAMRISDLIRDIKNNSSNFINERGWLKQKFSWQEACLPVGRVMEYSLIPNQILVK